MPGIVGRSLATCAVCSLICSPTQGRKLMAWSLGSGVSGMSGRLEWHLLQYAPHRQLKLFVQDLNHIYRSEPALHNQDFQQAGFEWIDCTTNHSGFVHSEPRILKISLSRFAILHLSRIRTTALAYRAGFYTELFNSDASTVVAIWKSWWQMDR